MFSNIQKETRNNPADWPCLLVDFIDLPGASGITNLPDIKAFNEPGADAGCDVESTLRWESEGGKIQEDLPEVIHYFPLRGSTS